MSHVASMAMLDYQRACPNMLSTSQFLDSWAATSSRTNTVCLQIPKLNEGRQLGKPILSLLYPIESLVSAR